MLLTFSVRISINLAEVNENSYYEMNYKGLLLQKIHIKQSVHLNIATAECTKFTNKSFINV